MFASFNLLTNSQFKQQKSEPDKAVVVLGLVAAIAKTWLLGKVVGYYL